MKLSSYWIFLALIGLGMNALAQADLNSTYNPQYFETSLENRRALSFSLEAQLLGSSVGGVPGSGLSVGSYITPDWQIFASYVSSPEGYEFDHSSAYETNMYASMYGLGGKNYLGNSFYVRYGIFARKIGAEAETIEGLYFRNSAKASLEVTSLGADFAIGNQWQWDNFTLGCDWIGYYKPISVLSTKTSTSGDSDEFDLDDVEEIGRMGSLSLLRFYIGVGF